MSARSPRGSVPDALQALERLLAAQQLARATQAAVLASRVFSAAAPATRALVVSIREADAEHVTVTRAALVAHGGHPMPAPAGIAEIDRGLALLLIPGRPARLRGLGDALTLLVDVEKASVGAAYVAVSVIADGALAGRFAAIMASDAQHQALLRERLHPGALGLAIPYGVVEGID